MDADQIADRVHVLGAMETPHHITAKVGGLLAGRGYPLLDPGDDEIAFLVRWLRLTLGRHLVGAQHFQHLLPGVPITPAHAVNKLGINIDLGAPTVVTPTAQGDQKARHAFRARRWRKHLCRRGRKPGRRHHRKFAGADKSNARDQSDQDQAKPAFHGEAPHGEVGATLRARQACCPAHGPARCLVLIKLAADHERSVRRQ